MAVMVLANTFDAKTLFVLSLCFFFSVAHGARRGLADNANGVFDVLQFGADGEGMVDSSTYFQQAWTAACQSNGPSRLVIPPGKFFTSEMNFVGPCTSNPITIDLQGTILADTNLDNILEKESFMISHVKGLLVTGTGTYDGQGEPSWGHSACKSGDPKCDHLPVSLKFSFVEDSVVENINLVNSKGFQMTITNCTNFVARGLHITAPETSPNTDGIHISRSFNVTVTSSVIASGDDCISIGEGSRKIEINNINCGPGHGISVGSLGKVGDAGVNDIHVAHCTLTGTTNGARIKTFHSSPDIEASNIVYEDITMNSVANPIIIDQNYHSKNKQASKVRISDVHFRNIRGTTKSKLAVSLNCSSAVPCQGVELVDIDLAPDVNALPLSNGCANAQATFVGKQNPPAPVCA